jgi:hypothetical protein
MIQGTQTDYSNLKAGYLANASRNYTNVANAGTFNVNVNNTAANSNANIGARTKLESNFVLRVLASWQNIGVDICDSRVKVHLEISDNNKPILESGFLKRYGNLYETIYDYDNLVLAHHNARKGKGWYKEVVEIDKDPDGYLLKLQDMLKSKTYRTSEYHEFERNDNGKTRTIYKLPYYPDRVCQWAILQIIEPIFQKKLIYDTYSAIPGKGIHLGVTRLQKALQNKHETKYCLKYDIRKYYPSIDQDILKQQMRTIFKDPDLLWLLDEIIDSVNSGIPIGNYLSQWFGNLYLTVMDRFVKEQLKIKYYFRYMDDVIILLDNKRELHTIRSGIEDMIERKLNLKLKSNYQIFPTRVRGIDFVGYRFFGNHIRLRKSIATRLKRAIRAVIKYIECFGEIVHKHWCMINSYRGWLKWCDGAVFTHKHIYPMESYCDSYYKEVIKYGKF